MVVESQASNDLLEQTGLDSGLVRSSTFPFLEPAVKPGSMGQFGPYPVAKFLGAGSAGFVFEARDVELDRPVVLKILRPELANFGDHRRRFLREARAAAAIHSDHTYPIFQVGEEENLPYLVMPMLSGETLHARLKRVGRLSVPTALEIVRQTALGLAAAHAEGLIHRDIKPANLWLESETHTDLIRRVRILDFGLARGSGQSAEVTMIGGVLGTPQYMSPEQADSRELDGRSDLFSLGSTLYVALTGIAPFSGKSLAGILKAVIEQPHLDVALHCPEIPPGVSDLVNWLLSKRPEDRPASAKVLAEVIGFLILETGESSAMPTRLNAQSTPGPIRTQRGLEAPPKRPGRGSSVVNLGGEPAEPRSTRAGYRTSWLRTSILIAMVFLALGIVFAFTRPKTTATLPVEPPTIPVGILHSTSGTMKISEESVALATLLAIDEINENGGIGGRKLRAVRADIDSDPQRHSRDFAREAERLLVEEKCVVLFGCWTSASRKAVLPVLTERHGLLFYPVQYEGLERNPHVVYLGPGPNQQTLPAVEFLTEQLGLKSLYLVGSDYVFPRCANEIIRQELAIRTDWGGNIVGEAYRPLGSKDWSRIVEKILQAKPQAIVNSINGSSAFAFYEELRKRELELERQPIPILSLSLTENELGLMERSLYSGDYLAGGYFSCVETPESRAFHEKIQRRSEGRFAATDMMAAAYTGVHLWAQAARKHPEKLDWRTMAEAVRLESFVGPTGRVKIDAENGHAIQPIRIARLKADPTRNRPGLEIVWEKSETIRPVPYPPPRSIEKWNQFTQDLYRGWDGQWHAPAKP